MPFIVQSSDIFKARWTRDICRLHSRQHIHGVQCANRRTEDQQICFRRRNLHNATDRLQNGDAVWHTDKLCCAHFHCDVRYERSARAIRQH